MHNQRRITYAVVAGVCLLLAALLSVGGAARAEQPGPGANTGANTQPLPGRPQPSYHGAAAPATRLQPPAAPFVTLYDQYNNPGTNATVSQDFEPANAAFNNQLADDFPVPSGQNWQVTEV